MVTTSTLSPAGELSPVAELSDAGRISNAGGGAPAQEGNQDFNRELAELDRRTVTAITNRDLGLGDYLAEREQIEEDRRQFLERWQNNPSLSQDQREDMAIMNKSQAYSDEGRQINQRFRENPNDPEARQAYERRQGEIREFEAAMANDPDMGQYQSVQRIKELGEQLEQARGNESQEQQIRVQMAAARRELAVELLNDPEGADRISRFVMRNQDNTVIRNSGLGDLVATQEARRQRDGLGDMSVTPDGAGTPGAVVSGNEQGLNTGRQELAIAADDGRGAVTRANYVAVDTQTVTMPTGGIGASRGGGGRMA